jgi:hypothetical protein
MKFSKKNLNIWVESKTGIINKEINEEGSPLTNSGSSV